MAKQSTLSVADKYKALEAAGIFAVPHQAQAAPSGISMGERAASAMANVTSNVTLFTEIVGVEYNDALAQKRASYQARRTERVYAAAQAAGLV